MEGLHADVTRFIIKAFYNTYNRLGYGFLEKVYENALMIELRKVGREAEAQVPIDILYDSISIGNYYADIIVNKSVIVELKACDSLCEAHERQLLNYLRASNVEVGLLFNFGEVASFKRKIYSNHKKIL